MEARGPLGESVLSFHPMDLGDQSQVVRLDSINPPSHLTGCVTLLHGRSEQVSVHSKQGASGRRNCKYYRSAIGGTMSFIGVT